MRPTALLLVLPSLFVLGCGRDHSAAQAMILKTDGRYTAKVEGSTATLILLGKTFEFTNIPVAATTANPGSQMSGSFTESGNALSLKIKEAAPAAAEGMTIAAKFDESSRTITMNGVQYALAESFGDAKS